MKDHVWESSTGSQNQAYLIEDSYPFVLLKYVWCFSILVRSNFRVFFFFEVFWGQTQETGSKTRDICCKWGDDMATGQLEEKLQVSQENHLSLMKKSHGGRSKPP